MVSLTEGPRPRVICAGHIGPVQDWRIGQHRHDTHHELIVVTAGRLRASLLGQCVVAGPGEVLYYRQGIDHEESALGHQPLETWFFGWTAPPELVEDWPLVSADGLGRMQVLARWLTELLPARDAAAQRVADALIEAAALEYSSRRAGSSGELVQRVEEYIRSHLTERLTLSALVAAAGLSRFRFAHAFRAAAGRSPMRYVAERRVQAAQALILGGMRPLRRVAELTGFADEFHLSRVFRRVTGRPPGQAIALA